VVSAIAVGPVGKQADFLSQLSPNTTKVDKKRGTKKEKEKEGERKRREEKGRREEEEEGKRRRN
jgi:hypothetical protein